MLKSFDGFVGAWLSPRSRAGLHPASFRTGLDVAPPGTVRTVWTCRQTQRFLGGVRTEAEN
jgi:hypothetical protein